MPSAPLVDVIIPIHDATRPLTRTLTSLQRSGLKLGSELRINVVCHNVTIDSVRDALSTELRDNVRFLACNDGLPSPAGPRTVALEQSDARYVSFVDSDDLLEDGALLDWTRLADEEQLDAVIPAEQHDTGKMIRTPLVRPGHIGDLDPIRDRLSYRTAPLGLIRRSTIHRLDIGFQTGVRNGSDQIFALKVWFGETRVRFARRGPAYVVGSDATTRVTTQLQPLESELRATMLLFDDPWFCALSERARHAIVVKFLRIQFTAAVTKRLEADAWNSETRAAALSFMTAANTASRRFRNSLSIADLRFCNAIIDDATAADLLRLAKRRRRFGTLDTLLTPRLRYVLEVNAPLRVMAASVLH